MAFACLANTLLYCKLTFFLPSRRYCVSKLLEQTGEPFHLIASFTPRPAAIRSSSKEMCDYLRGQAVHLEGRTA